MIRRCLASVALLALAAVSARSEQPFQPSYRDPLREPWRWRSFADMNGLEAQCVAEAKDGTLWIGMYDGLSSYDGFEWKRHQAPEVGNMPCGVTAICIEPDGTLDAGGWWGISQVKGGKWSRLVPAGDLRFADIRHLAHGPDGSLWAATSWGALRGQGGSWTLYTDEVHAAFLRKDQRYGFLNVVLLPDAITVRNRSAGQTANRADLTELAIDSRGAVWFGTKGGEILRFHERADNAPGTWTLFNEADGVPAGRLPGILPLRDGRLLAVVAPSEELAIYDGRTWQTVPMPQPGVAVDGCRLLETSDGTIWISARYILFAYRNGRWSSYQKPDVGLPTALNLILESKDGALWLISPSNDIQRVDHQTSRWQTLDDLNFQWESPAGAQWFLHRDGRVVLHDRDTWRSFGVEDGLIDTPVALTGANDGSVWAAGSHEHVAATARFQNNRWIRQTHPDFSWGVDARSVHESSDGTLWFGAAVDSSGPKQHRDGILQYRKGQWIHHHQPGRSPRADGAEFPETLLPPGHRPEPIEKFSCIGESRDGRIWAGRNVLAFHDGRRWQELFASEELRFGVIESMLTTREGDLWLGTRQYGALRFDGRTWQGFLGKGSLEANSIRSLVQTADGSIWAATDRGFSRFDGRTWTNDVLSDQLKFGYDGGSLKAAPSGTLWVNRHTVDWLRRAWTKAPPPPPTAEFWTVCHQFAGPPPDTIITAGAKQISQPGNISILWSGVGPWREAKDVRLQFSFRLDDGSWSAFTTDRAWAFFTLPTGKHHFEVRARDQDFNVDPTPATLDFVVLPPVWRQPWFILLMVVLGGALAAQTFRVLLEKRRLQAAHGELEERVRQRTAELEVANQELESFSYSVSHDLRAPLRTIDGFSRALLEDYEAKLDQDGRDNLHSIRNGAQRMANLIEALLGLSRVTRGTLRHTTVNLSSIAQEITAELARAHPGSRTEVSIAPDIAVNGDPALLRNVLQNLLGNAWKFSQGAAQPRIEFGAMERNGESVFFVRDNGAGFDRARAKKLFGAFQRFHTTSEFPGTGIGLATVQRIIHRHGGTVDAESRPGEGALFTFTLPPSPPTL